MAKAQRAALERMTDAEIERVIAQCPPDPELLRAIELLSDAELECVLDGTLSRSRILKLAAGRTQAP